ncbi:hypothetical protein HII31_07799 [Pseudocercospora fuligena]|uniref:DUF7371 domain-containing protein n=1 Tax=Pseudocercospora fuligena TaxID=685502 RepID=A0A8H6VL15_9PEZI|nr:hypothetical protein HII31_07799 [Pseudocercospora fuligena]
MKAPLVLAATAAVAVNANDWNGTYWNSTVGAGFAAPSNGRLPYWREHMMASILLLIVFGIGWHMLDHILTSTRASAACSPMTSTVYVPFTETHTVYSVTTASPSSVEAAGVSGSSSSTESFTTISTITSTSTHTNTVTVAPTTTAGLQTSSSSTTYFFHVTSGSTVWENGISPSSGVPLSIETSSVFVAPLPSTSESDTTTTVVSTSHISTTTTITVPEYTSTVFSFTSPDLTTTRTSTQYTTISLSQVSSHSSFTGMNSAGWNASSTLPAILPTPEVTTMTMVVMQGSGNATTNTITTQITATIGDTVTQTLVGPSGTGASEAPVVLTMTVGSSNSASAFSTSMEVPGSAPVSSNAPVSAESAATAGSQATSQSSVVPGTTTLTASAGTSSLAWASSSTFGMPPYSSRSNTSAQQTARSNSSTVSHFTITSFVSGSGTTFVLTSTPIATTPRITTVNGTISTISAASGSSTHLTTNSTLSRGSSRSSTVSVASTISKGQSLSAAEATSATTAFEETSTAETTSSVTTSFGETSTAESSQASVASISSTTLNEQESSTTNTFETGGTTLTTSRALTGSPTSSVRESGSSSSESSRISSIISSSHRSDTAIASSTVASSSTRARNTTTSVTDRPTRASTSNNPFPPTSNTAIPTQGCGEQGDFTMDFDDLPTFSGGNARLLRRQGMNSTAGSGNSTSNGNGTTEITQQPPLSLRPYRHMLFSNGYVYAPKPVEPFAPASSPNVAVFLANGTGFKSGPEPNRLEPGEMGDGPYHEGDPAFFFDAKGAALGCDNAGPGPCTLEVTSMVWDNKTRDDVPSESQNYTLPACEGFQNCQLTKVDFPSSFRKLSGLRMRAVHNQEPRMFFVDDMKMRWADNSCAAGMKRQRTQ